MKRYLLTVLSLLALHAQAAISVRDDAGHEVVLQQPAKRIITLAPHITELLFAAGGGDRIVGVDRYSDYPPAAKDIARVGDSFQIDMERLIAMKPDLLVVWLHGNSERLLEPLRKLGIPIFNSEPRKLDDIPDTLLRLGRLMGTEKYAQQRAGEMTQQLAALAARYRNRPPVRVFYQISDQPLYTLNGEHIVSDALHLCGGENVFSRLPIKAPAVNVEAVLLENPEVIIGDEGYGKNAAGLDMWKRYPSLQAVRRKNLLAIDGNLMIRSGPRLIAGAARLCELLEQARSRRPTR